MMRHLLFLVFAGALISGANAQCTPNTLYADSVYGVWPDTTQNFVGGMVGVPYSDTLNVLVPSDATLVSNTIPPGTMIDSVAVTSVDGLPPGITVDCNSQSGAPCTFLPNVVGCGLIAGMPTTPGSYPVTINVLAYANFLGFPVTQSQSFGGYEIVISPNVGINDGVRIGLDQVSASPNPFNHHTNIQFTLSRATAVKVKVFNMLGEELWHRNVEGKQGQNAVACEPGALQDGVYLYKVEAAGHVFTGRMVVER